MVSILERHQRTLMLLGLCIVFLISGVHLMDFNLEGTGMLFLVASSSALLYIPLFWLFVRLKNISTIQSWLQKEVWVAAGIMGVLFIVGVIESYGLHGIFTILFIELLLVLIVLVYENLIKTKLQNYDTKDKQPFVFPPWLFWLLLLGNGICIIGFEDNFRDNELFDIAALFYFLSLFILLPRWFFQQIKSIISLKNEQKKTELIHLQSQVNPHFFFNMLNNLYGWVEKDPQQAKELILQLSNMMRYSIYEGQKDFVSLEEEVEYLKNYIELHQMRYYKEIQVTFTVDIQEANYQVLPLLFIILLENAFKHGVENLTKNAYIHVHLAAQNKEISCYIENNFNPTTNIAPPGIGLKNLQRRLELGYPKKHTLSLTRAAGIYKAVLTINLP